MNIRDILLNEENTEKDWKEMGHLLKTHDWMFSMANGDAYYKGLKVSKRIRELEKKLGKIDKERLIKLYKTNVPKHILDYFVDDWEKNI